MKAYMTGMICGALLMCAGLVVFVIIATAAEARRCDTPCQLEQRIEALEQQLAGGYWYPYPPNRDEAEMN